MKTSEQWLEEVKTSPEKLNHWLQRQYVGEWLAASRIYQLMMYLIEVSNTPRGDSLPFNLNKIDKIHADELKHAFWIKSLLEKRNIELPELTYDDTRYWKSFIEDGDIDLTIEELMAVGHHAEHMRLVRIRLLATDPDIDADIREVFQKILPDEEYHDHAFASMSTPESIEKMRPYHEQGLKLLGLEI